jgi:protein-disulfide isomerase
MSKRGKTAYKRRRRSKEMNRWLPWAIGGAIVLMVVLVVVQRATLSQSPDKGYRDQEWFAGVTGTSYNAGETEHTYPDPANLGDGQQWLPALGEVNAPVVVMEFSDVFCGHCRDYNLDHLESILEEYVASGQVRYVDHYFGFGQSLQEGVVLAEMCAAEQGRYFEYKHALFQTVEAGAFDLDRAALVAGMDMDAFRTCREEQRYAEAMQEMVFVDNNGVNATPTFFINEQMISGNRPDEIRQAIEAELTALD